MDKKLINMDLMILKTPYDVLCSSFHSNWISHKQYGKDFTFHILCDSLIKDQQKLLEQGKLGRKNHAHLLKSKVNPNPKECG